MKMDILSPDFLWIGDRCYRLPVIHSSSSEHYEKVEKDDWVENESLYDCMGKDDDYNDDNDADNIEDLIETLPNNRYKLNLKIPQTFWSKIIGSKGVTKRRIESDTNTTIIIPRQMEQGDVVIKGSSKRSLILAQKSIEAVVFSARQKLDFTHFISIPMNGEEIKGNFLLFKEQVLKIFGTERGVDETIFQNPDKLHLTIGTLVLTDQNERNLAEKVLNEAYTNSICPLIKNDEHCIIEMRGIEYMNDDPAEVDVLYAKVSMQNNVNLVQKIADVIVQCFSKHKLIKSDEKEQVKLHVTLMNTLFREEEPEEMNEEIESSMRSKWNKKTRRTFNASNILQNFHDFYFGQEELKSIQLSVRFSTAKDGYYKSSCVINI